jgi:hypothetical protein
MVNSDKKDQFEGTTSQTPQADAIVPTSSQSSDLEIHSAHMCKKLEDLLNL